MQPDMEPVPINETSSMEPSPQLKPVDDKTLDDVEAGYLSSTSSTAEAEAAAARVSFTPSHFDFLNKQLEAMHPKDILRFAKILFPNLYQSTAFGLTGLVTLDMLSKIEQETPSAQPVHIIFLDTLYHFSETYALVDRVRARYPAQRVHVFKPDGFDTAADFEATYGKLYELSEEMYDWVAKVEPQQRAFDSLGVTAVLTGRRRSQGGQRDKIGVLELDGERGIIKINPLVNWSFAQVQAYIRENDVPYNELLDRGYKSIGDWHSTSPVAAGEDERAGRWKGRSKTECGIHNKKSRYAQFLEEEAAKKQGEPVPDPAAVAPAAVAPAAEVLLAVGVEITPSSPPTSLIETISAQIGEAQPVEPSIDAKDEVSRTIEPSQSSSSSSPSSTSSLLPIESISPSPKFDVSSSSFIAVA